MYYLITFFVGVIAGAVGMFLFYRKNAATVDADAAKAKAALDAINKK